MRAGLPCMRLQFVRGMAFLRSSGYIGGIWKDCDVKFPVYNPATGEEIGRVSSMGRKDAEEAVTQAYEAFKSWKNATANVCEGRHAHRCVFIFKCLNDIKLRLKLACLF